MSHSMKAFYALTVAALLAFSVFVVTRTSEKPAVLIRIISETKYEAYGRGEIYELAYSINGVTQYPADFKTEADLARYVEYLTLIGEVSK